MDSICYYSNDTIWAHWTSIIIQIMAIFLFKLFKFAFLQVYIFSHTCMRICISFFVNYLLCVIVFMLYIIIMFRYVKSLYLLHFSWFVVCLLIFYFCRCRHFSFCTSTPEFSLFLLSCWLKNIYACRYLVNIFHRFS